MTSGWPLSGWRRRALKRRTGLATRIGARSGLERITARCRTRLLRLLGAHGLRLRTLEKAIDCIVFKGTINAGGCIKIEQGVERVRIR